MVESVDELHPQLNFHPFSDAYVFAQAEVSVVDWIDAHIVEEKWQSTQVIHWSGAA